MISLVDFDDAKFQINDDVIDDLMLWRLMERASAVVLGEIRSEYPGSWEVEGSSPLEYAVPLIVQQVTLAVMATLHQDRENPNPLTPAMIGLLAPYRDPTCV